MSSFVTFTLLSYLLRTVDSFVDGTAVLVDAIRDARIVNTRNLPPGPAEN
jgi:hypothetical protein